MSLSWYMMARCRNEPVIALPIFPLRMQIHPYIFCAASSRIDRPEDLKGKKIGMDEYRLTVGLWARGILREYYGVRPEECEWFTSAPERAGYQPPADVNITVVDEPTEALLLRGEIDALIPPYPLLHPPPRRGGGKRWRLVAPRMREFVGSDARRKEKIWHTT